MAETIPRENDARRQRGEEIAKRGGQIVRLDDLHYTVRSQSSEGVYEIVSTEMGWTCACPDHVYRDVCCKHIHAVEISRKMREAVQKGATTTIREVNLGRCKFCDSASIVRKGIKKAKNGDLQMFGCKDCKRRFVQNLGFERKQATPEQITTAVDLVFSGLSTRKVARSLEMTGLKITHVTVFNWATEYGRLMEWYLDKITPQVGEQWRTDEIFLMIMGNRRYLFSMLDTDTRYWLAKMVAEHKGNDDVAPMFEAARKLAGKVPETLVSDGAANFGHAHKKQYAAKNFLHKDSEHVKHIHMAGDTNNNQMESFNGNTVRHREKVVRGLKTDDSAILSGPPGLPQPRPPASGPAWRPDPRRGGRHQDRGRQQVEDHHTGGGKAEVRRLNLNSPYFFFGWFIKYAVTCLCTLGMKNILVWKNRDCWEVVRDPVRLRRES